MLIRLFWKIPWPSKPWSKCSIQTYYQPKVWEYFTCIDFQGGWRCSTRMSDSVQTRDTMYFFTLAIVYNLLHIWRRMYTIASVKKYMVSRVCTESGNLNSHVCVMVYFQSLGSSEWTKIHSAPHKGTDSITELWRALWTLFGELRQVLHYPLSWSPLPCHRTDLIWVKSGLCGNWAKISNACIEIISHMNHLYKP